MKKTLLLLVPLLLLAGCGDKTLDTPTTAESMTDATSAPAPDTETQPDEFAQYEGTTQLLRQTSTPGEGRAVETMDNVVVHYTGYLTDGSIFDSSVERDMPFKFTVGAGQVIKGWDQGVVGMTVGEKRRLVIPYDLAYGEAGRPPVIPQKATLIFDVELLEIRDNPFKQ